MDTTTQPITPIQEPALELKPSVEEIQFSLLQWIILIVLAIYLIHVLMGWPYAFFWWPFQNPVR